MKKILILIACTLVTVSIFANQDVNECSSINDDTERLTCYDKFFSSSNDLVVINSDTVIEIKEVETEELETINNENSLLAETTKETDLEEKKIENLIDQLGRKYSIVIVTHSMQQAARVSQRTGFFHMGELIETGETQKIFTNPENEKTQGYITGRFG